MIDGKHILLIVSGGIAAYKALELIRLIQKAGGTVQAILTGAATEFVTPLSVSALSGNAALTELFDLTQEARIGHIELSRSADLIVIAPASADLLAKLAHGLADDLASTCLLATDTAILAAPAMNVRMWQAAATRRNIDTLTADGVKFVGPDEGPMACGEYGPGRMAEPAAILHAIGSALLALGAKVTFVTGPAEASPPLGATIVRVETAIEMRDAVLAALPADAAICVAAVADWRVVGAANQKIKKGGADPVLKLAPNPDILAEVSALPRPQRPTLVVGFAAETENLVENAKAKHQRKGCDWLLANDVGPRSGVFGGDATHILFLGGSGLAVEDWGVMSKAEVGVELAERLARALS
jgi:phosphopantothenoylcysteine decarboxylase / phosphopantothenate---cysteine ligase